MDKLNMCTWMKLLTDQRKHSIDDTDVYGLDKQTTCYHLQHPESLGDSAMRETNNLLGLWGELRGKGQKREKLLWGWRESKSGRGNINKENMYARRSARRDGQDLRVKEEEEKIWKEGQNKWSRDETELMWRSFEGELHHTTATY